MPNLPANLEFLNCRFNQLDFADLEVISKKPEDYIINHQNYTILPATLSIKNSATLTIKGTIGGSMNVYQ